MNRHAGLLLALVLTGCALTPPGPVPPSAPVVAEPPPPPPTVATQALGPVLTVGSTTILELPAGGSEQFHVIPLSAATYTLEASPRKGLVALKAYFLTPSDQRDQWFLTPEGEISSTGEAEEQNVSLEVRAAETETRLLVIQLSNPGLLPVYVSFKVR